MFFTVSSWLLGLVVFAITLGAAAVGLTIGHAIRHHAETISEPFAVLHGAMLGVVGLRRYADTSIGLAAAIPGGSAARRAAAGSEHLQRALSSLAGRALDGAPQASAPRLYVESRNETFADQAARVAGLGNRVPTEVPWLEVGGAAVTLGLLAAYLAVLGRAAMAVMLAAVHVALLLLVTFGLDRPARGLIKVPAKPLVDQRAAMALPPAASGSEGP